ncbi:FAD binding domain-containing protein [Pseudemcibacter aquimaris]|uniref:FAD binding domain-containing protein n=1 Tax=Pseudemcibacter aquimaris TaxID=2857064 RepID=UPI0020111127|nr:xanthine dehydrogenase family protein subunit M [Pseudemcibacter aquimaris]MCC3860392.1 xanthine dehydrogenase family protein subunit M [Pseudemcibacter aquimaris]WDU57718.1 xanthine dehydrogenase family protein subunit M [Pseudemcibacter aquimaris]
MRDMMPNFNLVQPTDLASAISTLADAGENGWAMAGGQDSLDWFKDRIKRPSTVVDLSGVPGLTGITETADGGVEIGAMTTLTDVENNDIIKSKFGVLAMAAGRVASPQIRNQGTLGGNISQDARCWYYRSGLDCYRAGGNTCYADTPEGMNREHCLFGASRCVAVTPSDTAVAVATLEAEMVIAGPGGERTVPASDFFIGPAIDITRMTVLEPGEVLTTIRIPGKWAGAQFFFEKVADRNTWDFPLVNMASAMKVSGGVIEDITITCGAVECVPKRLNVVEDIVKGSATNEETAELAAGAASRGASPLNYNHFKIPLMENLVKKVIRG